MNSITYFWLSASALQFQAGAMLARFHRDGMDGLIGRCGGTWPGFGCGFGCGCVGISISPFLSCPTLMLPDFLSLRQHGKIEVGKTMN